MKRLLLPILLWPLTISAQENFWSADVWKDDARGFLFYGPDRVADKEKPVALESIKTVEALHAERDRRLHRAIMEPTADNIASYQAINTFMLEKSALFADMWRRSLWANPQFDFTVEHPAANFAQVALKDDRREARDRDLAALAAEWGLIVVIDADCPYCDLMAPIARQLTADFAFEVLAINVNARPSAAWPEAKPDNGTLARLVRTSGDSIEKTPSIFLVHRDGRRVLRVASGVIAYEELIHRIHTLTAVEVGHALFGGRSS